MVCKYKNQYFDIYIENNIANIWRYDAVDGFTRVIEDDGFTYWEEFVPFSEIEEWFEPSFSVYWKGRWFYVELLKNFDTNAYIVCLDKEFAETHGFIPAVEERGQYLTWEGTVSLADCTELKFNYHDYCTKEDVSRIVTKEEFLELYRKYKYELNPNNFRTEF